MKPILFCLAASLSAGALEAQTLVAFTFGTSGNPTTSATTAAENVLVSSFTGNIGTPNTSSSSPGSLSAGGSGGSYYTASNFRTADNNYFEFTLTPAAGYEITLTGVSFFYLSTSSGPTTTNLLGSLDDFGSNLASFALTRTSGSPTAADWHLATGATTLTFGTSTTFRLSATGASSAAGSLKLDDFTIHGSVSQVPEPSTYAAITGVVALAVAAIRRRRREPKFAAAEVAGPK